PREISMKDVFRSGDSSKKFKIAEGQWYRYAPSYVSPAYHLLEGFPFIQEPPSGDLQERVLIRHHDYDQCFQSVQLLQWKIGRASCRERVRLSGVGVSVDSIMRSKVRW